VKNYVDEKQFKADIRKYAQQNHISGNEIGRLWQEVMLDDLLKRISLSKYKDNFILKGGLLLSAVVGINNRSTEDIDGEIKGFDLTESEIEKVFTVICNTKPDNDPLEIALTKIESPSSPSTNPLTAAAQDEIGAIIHTGAAVASIR
jgi:hypothetical protein